MKVEDVDENASNVKVAAVNKGTDHQNISNCDSSSGISSSSATSLQRTVNPLSGANGDAVLGDHQHYQHFH